MVDVIFQFFFLFFFIFFFEEGGVYFLPLYIVLNFYSKIWISFIGVMNSNCKFKSFCSNNINFYLLVLISTTPWKFCSCSQEMKVRLFFFFFFHFGTFRCFRVLSTFYCLQYRDRTEIYGNFNNIDHPRLKSAILNFDYGNLKQSSFPFCQI